MDFTAHLERAGHNYQVRLTSFQRLALSTTATTYFLILVGGLVRASGAGLGCPDWPRCFGGWIPPASAADLPAQFDPALFNATLMWTEYLNRILGVAVGFLILATTISAWRHHRREPDILWTTVAAFLLVGFEGWLGGRVVMHGLTPWIVTAHLMVALIIVQLLLYATYAAFDRKRPLSADRTLGLSILSLIGLTLLQVGFGTQVRERVDHALDAGVARDLALGTVGRLDFLHRDLAFVVLLGATLLTLWLWSRGSELLRWSLIVLALAVLQVALGAFMAYGSLVPAAQVGHLTLASLLLGAETVLWLMSRRR
jgi:cytochrome c oxidase assembly protein subunit 15